MYCDTVTSQKGVRYKGLIKLLLTFINPFDGKPVLLNLINYGFTGLYCELGFGKGGRLAWKTFKTRISKRTSL